MNITDIDDKIIDKSVKEKKSYKEIGDYYYAMFLDDIESLNIWPIDIYIKVTDHIEDIIDYISQLESNGYAYVNDVTNDVNFDTQKLSQYIGVKSDKMEATGKKDPRDFALWRRNEYKPNWTYRSKTSNKDIIGRPGK